MSTRGVVVVHGEPMVAEGIAAGLDRYRGLVVIGVATSAAEAEARGARADAIALDERLPGAIDAARRLQRIGVRVVLLGDGEGEEGQGVRVSLRASVATLAAALVPGITSRPNAHRSLTKREHEVLALVSRGLAGKQVARHLNISPKTVEHHKARIFAKLGVANQTAAVSLVMAGDVGGGTSWRR